MASMSLAGVLACFMGNDMGCDYFFWLLLAEWFGLGVALPGLPSYPVVQKLSPVLTEHGVVTPVSLRTLLEEFPCLCGLLALSAHGDMVHYFVMALVSGSRCRCVWVLPVGYDWISGRCSGRNAWFDSGWSPLCLGVACE